MPNPLVSMGQLILFFLLSSTLWQCLYGAPTGLGILSTNRDVVKLSPDVETLKQLLLKNEVVEIFDNKTLLLYKPEAVYQINVPQEIEGKSEETIDIEPPLNLIKYLESLNKEKITAQEFYQLTEVKQNADMVFNSWDLNKDGFLDKKELLQEENRLTTNDIN